MIKYTEYNKFANEQNEADIEDSNAFDNSEVKNNLWVHEWSNFNYKQFLIWSVICIVVFGFLVGIEFTYRNYLFEINSKTVPHFQYESLFLNDFMIALGYLGEDEGIAAVTFIFSSILSYSDGIITLILIILTLYINGIMKVLYHSPRPFFVAGDIKAYYWSKEYGNPSGHAMYIPSVLPLILYLVLRQIKLNLSISTKLFAVISTICITLMILLVSTILFGRIYLGVHSYNQVLYGSLLGIPKYSLFRLLNDHNWINLVR